MKYVAGWNMPGYLPEMEPAEFDDYISARDYIISELEMVNDDAGNANEVIAFFRKWDESDIKNYTTFSDIYNGVVYWISNSPDYY